MFSGRYTYCSKDFKWRLMTRVLGLPRSRGSGSEHRLPLEECRVNASQLNRREFMLNA
jgi:hypothetical protein